MKLRIAVVGSGAIGSYCWAKLAYGGSDVHFLESAAAFEQIKRTEKMSAYLLKALDAKRPKPPDEHQRWKCSVGEAVSFPYSCRTR
jgi:ketopantoate reductase